MRWIKFDGINHFANSENYIVQDILISDLVKKKVIYEYIGKQGFIDLSYKYQNANIYENRNIVLKLIVIGKGITQTDRENDAYAKIQALNNLILNTTTTLEIEASKYEGYIFEGVATQMNVEQKDDEAILSYFKCSYSFLIDPMARLTLDGCYPIRLLTPGKCGSYMKTNNTIGRNKITLYMANPVPVYISRLSGSGNYSVTVNGSIVSVTAGTNFTLDSLFFISGTNTITCPTTNNYKIKYDITTL